MRRSVRASALIAIALGCTGCPLMIAGSAGSAAYEGYKYEHKKKQPAASASSTKSNPPATSSQQTIPDSEIE